jgi:transposase
VAEPDRESQPADRWSSGARLKFSWAPSPSGKQVQVSERFQKSLGIKLVHAVVDNYATHKHPKVKAWLARWTFHFTPTSGSWLNAVETFFSAPTRKRIRRGSFHSLVALHTAIKRYLAEHNADPKPFVSTATPAAIMAKLAECSV